MAPRWYYCEPAWNWAPLPIPDYTFWFVEGGHGELNLGTRKYALQGGMCFLMQPGARPLGSHDPKNCLVVFSFHFTPRNESPALDCPPMLHIRDTAFLVAAAHRAEKLWRRGDEFAQHQTRLCLESLLFQFWDESRQPPQSPLDTAFEQLAERIRREPGKEWTLNGMADDVHLSRAQFVRRFRAQFGQSPARFVIGTRLERAKYLLLETNLTLTQIADALGYTNAQFLARQFKQHYRQTPGEWRREVEKRGLASKSRTVFGNFK